MIDPNDNETIENLEREEINFPRIQFIDNPLQRNRTTIIEAYTNIFNKGYAAYLADLDWDRDGDIDWQNNMLQHLHGIILQMIEAYRNNNNDELLKKIFIYIQLWGGNAGRNIFLQSGGFEHNFNIKIYKKFVKLTINSEFNNARIRLNKMTQIGTAFSTKHLHFWSNTEAPIYDSIISKIVFGRKNPNNKADYPRYMTALYDLAEEEGPNVTSSIIERSIFNWSDTEEGKLWSDLRMKTL